MLPRKITTFALVIAAMVTLSACTIIRDGEVGVKRRLGKFDDATLKPGIRTYNPFLATVFTLSTRTQNLEVSLSIPSKEGLNIQSEVSILYNIVAGQAPTLLRNIGVDYEQSVILPVFRSSVADVSARFFAKDMHSGERSAIERAIKEQMMVYLTDKGILIEAVLLKSIKLPENLSRAIEEKLEAEQQAQRMTFVLDKARQEAERQRIEAEGVRDAQKIISEGLNDKILQFKSLETFQELSKSPNTKIIVTDGELPFLIEPQN